MIVVDKTETRTTSSLPDIPGAVVSPTLEEISGSDILISPLTMPATTENLVRLHVAQGASLIQRKSGEDLVRSIGDRIPKSLAKMQATGAKQRQCILLSTGYYGPDFGTGNIWVGKLPQELLGQPNPIWHSVKWAYKALMTEITQYVLDWGGVYIPLSCDEEIPGWCRNREKRLIELHNDESKRVKELWPDAKDYPSDPPAPSDPLQELCPVTDGRTVLAAFKGVGPTRANALWDAIREYNKANLPDVPDLWEPRLEQAITWATAQDVLIDQMRIPKVKGWGSGTRAKVREQMGLQDGFDMKYFVNVDEELEKNRELLHGDGMGEI